MRISEYIQQQKERLFVARDADKLRLQKANLMKERQALQEKARLKEEVRKEQRQIRQLKSEPVRSGLSKIKQSIQGFGTAAKGIQSNVAKFGESTNANGPFSTGGPAQVKKANVQKADRPIIIKIGK